MRAQLHTLRYADAIMSPYGHGWKDEFVQKLTRWVEPLNAAAAADAMKSAYGDDRKEEFVQKLSRWVRPLNAADAASASVITAASADDENHMVS